MACAATQRPGTIDAIAGWPAARFRADWKSPMPTDTQISVMVEVAQSGGIDLNEAQKQELQPLLSDGLIEPASEKPEKYQLTDKGQKTLDERGVGANES